MGRFSLKAFVTLALLHLIGSMCLIGAGGSRITAYERGEQFVWLSVLSWIWMPVPRALTAYLHFSPAAFFYYLALPWSFIAGACCGLLVPRLLSSRRQIT